MNDLPEELQPGQAVKSQVSGEAAISAWPELLGLWARQEFSHNEENILSKATPLFERVLLESALESSGGRKQKAARLLGWGRNTLTRKLKELY
jgi:two-component system nitrogen regulation response regulator GlnG